ncbi:mannose-6-phosphate isomerase 1-like isoform X2 [Pistacia vera]|uniref:mannose-6-phosphate isomerase 1-like isoform X2 n=1 Tax=Pistacia vera TaxID=55513 RepID=UPI001262D033|nr:mannose-6-phosphate isomerase 1-like isoform X2 [Pistacia vera]
MEQSQIQNHNLEKKRRRVLNKPLRLRCSVQNYNWGILGNKSYVARLFSLNSGSHIDPDESYAELWIGTHESGPSFVDDQFGCLNSLKEWISKNPDVLGDQVLKKWGGELPFLFKALSIQAHPDKELARALHKSQPSLYKDDNHKPELALALTEFEALCGFISLKDLRNVLFTVPEIIELVGGADAEQWLPVNEMDKNHELEAVLESIFSQILLSSKDKICQSLSKLKWRLNLEKKKRQLTDKEKLVLRLEGQYPADAGVIAAFLLNYVKLNRGEALCIGANEPHAYIYGECIECMATSDNVVRAGLTSKHRDIQTLLSMLKRRQGFPEILQGLSLNQYTTRYLPPFEEFEVDRCILPEAASVVFPSVPGPSLLLFISGNGTIGASVPEEQMVEEGDILFLPAYMEFTITSESKELHLYRAGVNSSFFQAY